MDFFQKFSTEKVATHLKIFLGVIRNIWQGRNACDKKKIQHLLEAQCDLTCALPSLPSLSSLFLETSRTF